MLTATEPVEFIMQNWYEDKFCTKYFLDIMHTKKGNNGNL